MGLGSEPLVDSPANPQLVAVTASAKPQASNDLVPLIANPQPIAAAVPAAEEPLLPLIKPTKPEKKRRIPKWLERTIGHIIVLLIFAPSAT